MGAERGLSFFLISLSPFGISGFCRRADRLQSQQFSRRRLLCGPLPRSMCLAVMHLTRCSDGRRYLRQKFRRQAVTIRSAAEPAAAATPTVEGDRNCAQAVTQVSAHWPVLDRHPALRRQTACIPSSHTLQTLPVQLQTLSASVRSPDRSCSFSSWQANVALVTTARPEFH